MTKEMKEMNMKNEGWKNWELLDENFLKKSEKFWYHIF